MNLLHFLSQTLGWSYVLLWSFSFYPQPLLSYRRGSTHGLSADFALLNLLGLSTYTAFNAFLLLSPAVRAQYAQRHPSSPEPPVQLNDLVYAAHGAAMCLIIWSQIVFPGIWRFSDKPGPAPGTRAFGSKSDRLRRVSWMASLVFWGCVAVVVLYIVVVLISTFAHVSPPWELIDLVYTLGNIKLFLTVVKYAPQALLNYRRKSTDGFSVVSIMLDFTGGLLSVLQLLIDASAGAGVGWSGAAGNLTKLGLGNVTMIFDVTYMIQHYVLYKEKERPPEEEPLLS